MTGASGQHENMPYGMVIRDAPPYIKDGTEGVQQTASYEPRDASERKVDVKRLKGENNEPSHQNVTERRNQNKAFHKKDFEHDSGKGEPPDDAEKSPT